MTTEYTSYSGLFGTREEKLSKIKAMTNAEILRYYTLSCRSGEIEVNLAGEWDFDQFALKKELEDRLRRAGFLRQITQG